MFDLFAHVIKIPAYRLLAYRAEIGQCLHHTFGPAAIDSLLKITATSICRYLYMTGNFNSVNLDTTLPAEGGVWTIEFNADGTAKITNIYNSKFMQFDSQYNSYGIYPDARGTMPTLYKKN